MVEILFVDKYYDSEDWEEGKFRRELLEEISAFDHDVSAINTDIGHGADWPVVLVDIFKEAIGVAS